MLLEKSGQASLRFLDPDKPPFIFHPCSSAVIQRSSTLLQDSKRANIQSTSTIHIRFTVPFPETMTQNWAPAFVVIGLIAVLNICASVYAVFRDRQVREEGQDIEMGDYNNVWFPWRIPDDELPGSSSAT